MRAHVHAIVMKVRAQFSARRLDAEAREQIEEHLAQLAEDLERRGLPPGEARRQARLRFGGPMQALEEHRDSRAFVALDGIARDLRYAWRGLRRTPGFTALAIITLALGIGANTVFFGLVDAVVFRPTSVAHLDRVYALTLKDPRAGARTTDLQQADAQALEDHPPASVLAMTHIGCCSTEPYLVQAEGRAEYVLTERVSSGYAPVFDLRAQSGRWFSVDDNRSSGGDVVVISDRLWRQWFKSDPGIVNHASLTVGRRSYRIIGVAAPGFRGTQTGLAPTEVWYPIGRPVPGSLPAWQARALRDSTQRPRGVLTFIRSQPGLSTAQIAGDIRAMLKSEATQDPAADTLDLQPGQDALRLTELVALAAGILSFSGLVFFAACANLANMLYARGTGRSGEIAVRLSLGATARSIFGLFLAEATIISLSAAATGLALALGATAAFSAAFPTFRLARNLGVAFDLSPDYRVFFYAFAAGAVAALAVGLLTAWRSSRVPVIRALGSATTMSVVSSRRRSLPLTFVSVQITAAVLLMIGAGLFLENTHSALDRRIHYDTSGLAAARLIRQRADAVPADLTALRAMTREAREATYAEQRAVDYAQREAFFVEVARRVRALPGVEAAATTDALPGGTAPAPRWGKSILQAAIGPDDKALARKLDGSWLFVSPEFLDTIGVKVIRGRNLQPTDVDGTPLVAVLSQSAADGLWPGESAIGKTINCCDLLRQPITVVGVADDPASSSDRSPWTRYSNFVFLSEAQNGNEQRFIVVRARNPSGQEDAMRAVIRSVDERTPVFDAGPVDELLLAGVAIERAQRTLTTSLGLLSLGIAILGVYAVVSYFVSRRTREFGLRLALGAAPRQILKLVVDYAIHIILIGLLPGVFLASLGTRLFEHQLFGIMPNGIMMWVAAPLLMLAAGVAAGLVPARRAARVDPNVALRDL